MKKLLLFGSIAAILANAQTATLDPAHAVIRLDPALDRIISVDTPLDMLKVDHFGFTEGPLWVQQGQNGYLLFSEIAGNAVYKWSPEGGFSVYLEKSGFSGDPGSMGFQGFVDTNGRIYTANLGSNGIIMDPQGRLIVCAHGDRAIERFEKDGKRTVLADRYEGKRLNRPNDLVMKSDGSIYFTDPRQNSPLMEQATTGVYLLKNGTLTLLLNDFRTPNGLAFSPDEKYLYVNDSVRKIIMRYDVKPDDTITNGKVFTDMNDDKAPGNPDGMKVDSLGNVYAIAPGGVWIISPEGKHLGTILLPERGTNLAFGNADGKMLYITDRKSLGRIQLKVSGTVWKPAP